MCLQARSGCSCRHLLLPGATDRSDRHAGHQASTSSEPRTSTLDLEGDLTFEVDYDPSDLEVGEDEVVGPAKRRCGRALRVGSSICNIDYSGEQQDKRQRLFAKTHPPRPYQKATWLPEKLPSCRFGGEVRSAVYAVDFKTMKGGMSWWGCPVGAALVAALMVGLKWGCIFQIWMP